jgi:dTDP-4-dehydrorhamnose 3,5-epimerase
VTGTPAVTGVRWGTVKRFGDARGAFREVWRESAFPALSGVDTGREGARFVQANISTSAAGVLRGLHYHRRQLDHWVVLEGRAFVALVDVRPTATGGRPITETRVLGPDETVTIPTGVAHGFLALTDLVLMYLVTNEYDGTDELGFSWDDPYVAVPWPTAVGTPGGRPILSDRDAKNPPLRELIATLAEFN